MTNFKKVFYLSFLVIVGGFYFGTAHASTLLDNLSGNYAAPTRDITPTPLFDQYNITQTSATSSPGLTKSITVPVVLDTVSNCAAVLTGTHCREPMYLEIDSNSVAYISDNSFLNSDFINRGTGTFQLFTFEFSAGVDLSTNPITHIGLGPFVNFGIYERGYGLALNNADGTVALRLDDVINPSTTYIKFQTPQMREGFISPDFGQWWLCLNIPSDHTATAYSYTVDYGTSTPYGVGQDSLLTQFGTIPLTAGSQENLCPLLNKEATSTAGTYKAIATLYDQNNATITQSSVLNFTIIGGERTQTPPEIPGQNLPDCTPTAFAINFGFGSVDFGNGLCRLARFLFVPSPSSISQFTSANSVLATKPPFNYFYNLSNTIAASASSSSSTMTGLTLNIGSTSSPIHISQDMFSNTTIDKFTDSNSRSVVRTLAEYSIYLAFAAMIILEVRHLFKGGGTPKA